MKITSILLVLSALSCASGPAADRCSVKAWLNTALQAQRSQFEDIKPRYLKIVDIETVPEAARPAGIEWIDKEVAKLSAEQKPGDELWYFREDKCSGCHWYREGYVLVRGCEVVDELTLSDVM